MERRKDVPTLDCRQALPASIGLVGDILCVRSFVPVLSLALSVWQIDGGTLP